MKIPTIHGYIDRRILINFTADPAVIKNITPSPFRPQIYNGKAIVGICLIRLKNIKPKGFPDFLGVNSENGAHRIAVEWNEGDEIKTGVYIPRRDTSLKLNSLVGGRIFPGVHHYSNFIVKEKKIITTLNLIVLIKQEYQLLLKSQTNLITNHFLQLWTMSQPFLRKENLDIHPIKENSKDFN